MPYIIPQPQNNEPVYDRDEVVREVTSFYEFLTNLHIPNSALKIPPPGGWPDITPERYAFLKKDDTVIDLIRHLPFIYKEDYDQSHEIYLLTAAVDYNGPYVQLVMNREPFDTFGIEPMDDFTTLPPYMLTLASETSGGDGSYIFVNTKRGTITLYDEDSRLKGTIENEPAEEGANEDWRDHSTWRVKEFFDMLKEQYRKLELMPTGIWDVRTQDSGETSKKAVQIYEDCGWPSENYRKDECMQRLQKL